MGLPIIKIFLCSLLLLLVSFLLSFLTYVERERLNRVPAKEQIYIVQMKHQDKPFPHATPHDRYSALLQSLFGSNSSLLYTYTDAFNGFAAKLNPDQAESLRRSDVVLSVYKDTVYTLHTTRTPEFLGLNIESSQYTHFLEQASHDVIIGVLDTGIWPESKSFDDSGLPEIPSRWRGECKPGPNFSSTVCNKKLIGARSFFEGYQMTYGRQFLKEVKSPRDQDGHGTHTASTAAGSRVANASLFGYAIGTARGMATHARVAMYKVCWNGKCLGSDILAGLDWAINDGVDILSLSISGKRVKYFKDPTAIGAFTAVEKGIFVSCSAGNNGPEPTTVANAAPWIMTVGAGTLDRDFPAYVSLGNKNRFTGVSLYSGQGMGDKPIGLVYKNGRNKWRSSLCLPGSLLVGSVRGKVVVCDRGVNSRQEKEEVVRDAGGVGMILTNVATNGEELVAISHLLPVVAVGCKAGDLIKKYLRSDRNPTALLTFGGTVLNVRPAPMVAAFSSRGPNKVTPSILKPDVIGPGVNILAAWTENVGPTDLDIDTRKTQFNIISGTSMSCPHISGLAALLKAAHPQWSPSAIKSALMTTAYTQDNTKSPLQDAAGGALSNPWAYGAGHVDPHKALSPGLIYNISTEDYIPFLCSLDYTIDEIQNIVKRSNVTCSRKFSNPGELNYPSFSVLFENNGVVRYTRVLTNVGAAWSVYHVTVNEPPSVAVIVEPPTLFFGEVGDKQSYTVTFVAEGAGDASKSEFGSIVWSDGQHQVKSPIAFQWTVVKSDSKSIVSFDSKHIVSWSLSLLKLLLYVCFLLLAKYLLGLGNRPQARPPFHLNFDEHMHLQ